MIVRIAVRAPIMLVSALIMATFLSAKLSMVFLVMVPVLGGGLFFIAKSAHPIFESVFKTYDKLNLVVQENLYGIRVVKAFVREETEKEKFDSVSEDIYKKFSKAERIIAFNSPLMQFAVYGSILLISWFSAKFIVGGSMTTGQLISMITYTMQILMSLMMLSMIFVMIIISRASAERICEVLDEEPTIKYPENPIFEVKDGSIEFDGTLTPLNGVGSLPSLTDTSFKSSIYILPPVLGISQAPFWVVSQTFSFIKTHSPFGNLRIILFDFFCSSKHNRTPSVSV